MLRRSIFTWLSVVGLVLPAVADAQTPISPYLVGNNVWYKNPDATTWQRTRECGVKLIRIGGHDYDKNVPDDATLIAWIKQIRAIGAEPLVQVSQYGGPDRAAARVRLLNVDHAAGEPVKYWSIGNEPWLQNGRPDFASLPETVAKYVLPLSAAMKAVDPTIKVFAFDECDLFAGPHDALFGGASDITGKVPGKPYFSIDGLSWHRYPQKDEEPGVDAIAEFRDRSARARAIVDRCNALHGRTGDDAMTWAITEFNAKNGPLVHTWGNGQLFAMVYGYAMKHGAFTAATWSMFEHDGDRKGTDFSFLDGPSKTPRASYWHMKLVSDHFRGTYFDGDSSSPTVFTYAARDGDRWSVMLLNVGTEPADFAFVVSDATSQPAPRVTLRLDAPLPRELHGTIPPRTTQVWLIDGGTTRRIDYDEADFAAGRGPGEAKAIR